ncbi:GtrA family protein [Rhodoferax sp. AJA081-3]|uniref:GtrA family protein n=1 Tax=Rhodoferax sp. AJA081-3 TaxID=2752316 RepID=UPI001AE07314|nr:GtrA family protein [Rhodoferax sp. AJA081-3]QTN28834.1 GtrA family protein [Rhodoferax sp. AJA081-3]
MSESLLSKTLFRRIAGFSTIGVLNTFIHLGVVTALVELLSVHPVLANCLAFVVANVFSFYANSRWNYGTPMDGSRYKRFLLVSLMGLAITAGLSAMAETLGWHYLMGTAMVFVALPALTFAAHHYWTWAE